MYFQKSRRLLTALLAVFLCVFVFPISAMAAYETNTGTKSIGSVLDGKLTITAEWYSGGLAGNKGSCTLSNGIVTLTASGNKRSRNYQSKVTITNSTDVEAEISFTYSTSECHSYSTPAANGTYNVVLSAGESCTLEIRSKSYGIIDTQHDATLTLSGFSYTVVTDSAQVTVNYNEAYGTVTSGNSTIVNGGIVEGSITEAVTLTAGTNGGTFCGWVNGKTGAILTTDNTYTVYPAANMKVKAVFGSASLPCFYVGGGTSNPQKYGLLGIEEFTYHTIPSYTHLFDDLNTAATAAANSASKYIVLANNSTLPAGNYTIPSGVTLLIPFDENNTVYTDKAQWRSHEVPTPYRTLTMAEGANLTVNGAMCVAGKHCAVSQDNTKGGAPSGPQGYVNMLEGSTITVGNGGHLYAYGYIYGQGSVTANSGATVYEIFQVTDFRGAINSLTTMDKNKKVLPFSQYYIQNIEVALRLNYGATAKLLMNVMGSDQYFPSVMNYVGTGNGMFNNLDEGSYVIKQYDGATDRLKMDLYGNSSFYHSSLSAMGMSLDTINYVFPFNSNFDIHLHENSKLLVKGDACLLPGVTAVVDTGATISLEDGKKFYFYDSDQWDGYAHNSNLKLVPVSYGATKTYTRTEADLADVQVVLNGTFDSTNGLLYTTAGGANITSTGGGQLILPEIQDSVTYQAKYSGGEYTYPEIAVVSPILTNGDGSYVQTKNGGENTYTYINDHWCCSIPSWGSDGNCTICGGPAVAQNSTKYHSLAAAIAAYKSGHIQMLAGTEESIAANASSDVYVDLNSQTVNLTGLSGEKKVYFMDKDTDGYADSNGKVIASSTVADSIPTMTTFANTTTRYYVKSYDEATGSYSFPRVAAAVSGVQFVLDPNGKENKSYLILEGTFRGNSAAVTALDDMGFTVSGSESWMLATDSSKKLPTKDSEAVHYGYALNKLSDLTTSIQALLQFDGEEVPSADKLSVIKSALENLSAEGLTERQAAALKAFQGKS